MAMARTQNFRSPDCRLSYAQSLIKARAAQDGGKEKYGCTLIFRNEDRAFLEKQIAALIVEQWGEKGLERARTGLIKSPLLAGDGKEARSKKTGDINPGLGSDVFFVRATALNEVPVFYRSGTVPTTIGGGDDQVKSGDHGFGVINAFCWTNSQNGDGVSIGIAAFQKKRPGESLGGVSAGEDFNKWYEAVEDHGAAPDSTKSGAGAGGLFG